MLQKDSVFTSADEAVVPGALVEGAAEGGHPEGRGLRRRWRRNGSHSCFLIELVSD